MEITSLEVSPDHVVTLHMSDMPKTGIRVANTTVYVADVPLGHPDEVSGSKQEIIFYAGSATQSGKVSVMINVDGKQLTATSAEDYAAAEHDTPDQPLVLRVNPQSALPGGQVTLYGRNLKRVYAVALQAGAAGYYVSPNPITADTTVMFRVSPQAVPGGKYPIYIRVDEGALQPTNKTLEITKLD